MSDTFGKDFKRPLASSPADIMRSFGSEMAPHTRKRAWRNPGFDDDAHGCKMRYTQRSHAAPRGVSHNHVNRSLRT